MQVCCRMQALFCVFSVSIWVFFPGIFKHFIRKRNFYWICKAVHHCVIWLIVVIKADVVVCFYLRPLFTCMIAIFSCGGGSRFRKLWRWIGFYRASICEGGLGSRNSVCPSVTRVDCDKTKWRTADIFIPHERTITLLLWYQEWLVGDAPFPLKSAFKVTHPPSKNADFDRFLLITSQP